MKLFTKTHIRNLSIYIIYTVLISSALFIYSCGTAQESASYCDQLAQISATATRLLCEALSRPDTGLSSSHTNTLHYYSRVVVGDTISFLSHTSKSGSVIISWKSRHHPDGAVLIEPLPTQVALDSLDR